MNNLKTNLYRLFSVCIILLLSNFYSNSALGQCNPAASEPNFNPNDTGFGFGQGARTSIIKLVVMADNKILATNTGGTYNNQPVSKLFRLNEDGTLDNSFTLFSSTAFANNEIKAIEKLPNEQLLVSINIPDLIQRTQLVRLNADGSIDNSFVVTGLGQASYISNIVLQPDGKIIILGTITVSGNRNSIVRLNADGSLDNSFSPANTRDQQQVNSVADAALQSDGKIILVGTFVKCNGADRRNIARLNSDGTLDFSFTAGLSVIPGFYNGTNLNRVLIQSSGKVIIAGNFSGVNGTDINNIARLNTDGSLDMSFTQGTGFNGQLTNMDFQTDGKIIVGGSFSSYNGVTRNHLMRLNADGTADNSFVPVFGKQGLTYSVQLANGKILTTYNISESGIERLNSDGSYDSTFNPNTGFNNMILQTASLPNGQFYASGYQMGKYNGVATGSIAKLNADGSLDPTFMYNRSSLNNYLSVNVSYHTSLTPQPDGKLLVGTFTVAPDNNTSQILKLFRLNADGTLDNTFVAEGDFAPTTGAGLVGKVLVQPNGKILAAGTVNIIATRRDYKLVRFNSDGSLDASFPEITANESITDMILLPDGKILVAGGFSSLNGNPANKLARLLPNGAIDNTFYTDLNLEVVNYIDTLNNEIYVSGSFDNGSAAFVGAIRKVSNTGSMNPTFDVTLTTSGTTIPSANVLVERNGKMILAGDFEQVNGVNQKNLAKLNADGSLVTNFDVGTSTDGIITSAFLQADNSIIIAGAFLSYNGIGRNRVAKITNQSTLVTNVTPPNQQIGICRNITTNLVATGLGTIRWYDSPTNPTAIHVGNTLTTPLITADSTYFYAQDFTLNCGNSDRLAILVTVEDSVRIETRDITVYLNEMGTVEVNALQIDSLSRVACGDTIVSYTFRDTGLSTRSYSCADTSSMHEVWLQITDNNGNIDTAQAFIQVRDTIAPVVQNQPFEISLATNTGSVTVSALDFISSLSDNCTDSTDIRVVFADTGLSTKDFSCGSFTNTNLHITDNSGNTTIVAAIVRGAAYDLDVNLIARETFRPAIASYIQINAFNNLQSSINSCLPVGGQIQVTLDPLVSYNPFALPNPPSSVIGNVLTWDFNNLNTALPHFVIGFYVVLDSSLNIGDGICFRLKITPTNGDINIANNTKTYCYGIGNSYDPNDKQVYPQGICDAKFTKRSELPLTYTIRFQNTGNAPALNVRIADSLSTLLNRRSLRIVGTSHPMVVDTTANNNVINFRFPNINLPDSTTSPELSQGYVIFELNEIAAHTDTSRISNKSYIYFDTNAPIITNTVKNTIVNVLPLCNPTGGGTNPPIAVCTLPTNLRAEILTSTKIKLAWTNTAGTNAINYEILRNGQRLITVPASNLSFVDSTLIANTQYNYSIKAICGNSVATSNSVQVRTIPATPILLSVVAACKGEKGTINVQSAGATYRVYSSLTATTPLFETNNASIETPILNDSTTFYISVIINGLESQRLKAIVPIKEVFEAKIEQGNLFETCATEFNLSAKNVVGATYTWFRENLEVGTGRTLTTTFAARYKVRVIKNGCFADSEFTTTRFVSAPTAKIKQGTAITFCGSGTLNAQDTSANVVYTWSLNGSNVGNGTNILVSQSGAYTLKASQPSCESSVIINVTITNAPANVALTASKTAICTDTQTTISVTTGTGFTYKWFRNNIAISNTSATLSTSEIGKYKVEVTTAEGCKVTTSEVEISRLQVNQATLRINTESGRDKTIDVTSQDAIDSVQWFKNGVLIPAFANKILITPTETGNYKVKVTYSTGCKSETTEKMFTIGGVTGIEEESAKIFNIYPNPNTGSFKVEFATTTNQKTRLTLVDGLGRIIYSQEIAKNERNEKTISITLPKISAGVYVVQIISEGKVYTKQLIIQ